MALKEVKSVRVRGNIKPNEVGGLDGRLVLSNDGKDRIIIVYLRETNNLLDGFIRLTFTKKDHGSKSDDEIIKFYIAGYPKWSIIQDPYDPNVIPPDDRFSNSTTTTQSSSKNYTPDATLSQESKFLTRADIKPQVDSGAISVKSYTFGVQNPKNDEEKSTKVIIWIIDTDASTYVKNLNPDLRRTFTGDEPASLNTNTILPLPTAGNYFALSKFVSHPQKNPKDNKPITEKPEDFEPGGVTHLSLLAEKQSTTTTYKGPLNNVNDYIAYILWNLKYEYQTSIYGVVATSDADLPKFDLAENKVEFVQVEQQPQTDDKKTEQSNTEDQKKKEESDKEASVKKSAQEARLVNSKITLKKKSGPGEIVGVTEADLSTGQVSFSELQFTEPGEYVISVIGSSTQLLETEFKVLVEPAQEIVEQDSKGQEEPVKGTRPIIAQIDEPTISLPPMVHNETETQPDSDMTTNLGFVPFVYYGKAQIRPSDIQKLSIYYDEFVPKCVITFTDTLGLLNSPDTAPTANSTIEIFLNSGSAELKYIHLKFLIDQKKDNRNQTITIFGKLDLKNFYKVDFSTYLGTSFEVLRQISKELGLGYNSNIDKTEDRMAWIRNGVNYETFIRSIIDKSYISDESFMVGYIDYYYCFNFVDVEKEYKRDNTKDIGINSTGISSLSDATDAAKAGRLFLTNDKSMNSSPFHFSKYKFMNNSTVNLTNEGVTTDSKVYDRVNKRFLKFKVDSQHSEDENLKTLRSEDDVNTNYRTEFTGKLDTDNMHENALYAITQNKRNLKNLGNIMAELTLPIPNFNIYKFQKILVVFTNDRGTVAEPETVMQRYTGDWVIIDISYNFQKGTLQQNLTIARKELSKTKTEKETETTAQDNSQNSEINENPVLDQPPALPNSIYEVGQEVFLEQEGKMYSIVVESLSEDGQEISGKIKKSSIGLPGGYTGFTPGPIRTEAPKVSFKNTNPAKVGQIFTFENLTTGTPSVSYQWSFGDGATSTLASPTHSYSATGSYIVTLDATNSVGKDIGTASIDVIK